MTSPYFWSLEDVTKLEKAYEEGGLDKAQEEFPDVKRGTLATKASRLGITDPRPRINREESENE